jgi:16S rRNA U1498 N3-methylase RsmE
LPLIIAIGSHYFSQPEAFQAALLEGLMQSNADCWLPSYQICHKMKDLEPHLDSREGKDEVLKIVAHPHQLSDISSSSLFLNGTTNYGQRKRIAEMRKNEREDPDTLIYPQKIHVPLKSQSFSQLTKAVRPRTVNRPPPRMLIAVGPDGGWTDDELYFFHMNHFHFVNLGERILRTDMAVSPPLRLSVSPNSLSSPMFVVA